MNWIESSPIPVQSVKDRTMDSIAGSTTKIATTSDGTPIISPSISLSAEVNQRAWRRRRDATAGRPPEFRSATTVMVSPSVSRVQDLKYCDFCDSIWDRTDDVVD